MSRDYLWFQFWASDALSSVDFLRASPEIRGVWLTLLCVMWRNGGPVEYEPDELARLCGCNADAMRTLCERTKLVVVEGGYVRSDRLEHQREEVDAKSTQARQAARKRWAKNADAHADAYADGNAGPHAEPHADRMPVSSHSHSQKQKQKQRQTERLETGQSDSPVTQTRERKPGVRAPLSQSAIYALGQINEYLGDHAGVVTHVLETLSESEASRVMLSVNARWLPGGSMYADWGELAEERRPAALATALADFPWNGVVDLQHLRGFLKRIVRGEHKAKDSDEGWAWATKA